MPSDSKRILATIMFTDMVGYTALMQKDEVLARKKRDRHKDVFDQLHLKYNGQIIQYFGDGTLSIFDSSVNALECAIEMQLLLKEPIEVPLRIGIHTGDIVLEEDNIIGDAVNLASRIESFAVPGAVFISDTVFDQVKNQAQFSFIGLGTFQLKNVERPFEIYALSTEGLVVPDPVELEGKGKHLKSVFNNLPNIVTSLLGREKEISEIKKLLQDNRLITLTGPGGSGKTRLSLQIGQEVEDQYPDGIYWVPLASVMEADFVPYAIVQHLGLKEDALLGIEEQIINFFRNKKALMIVDNFEQIIGAAYLIEKLIHSCGKLSVLLSSRIVLYVKGEIEYEVPPLPIPKFSDDYTFDQLRQLPSISLFAQRAQTTRGKFQLTEENILYVAKICTKLDGLPLAIELAAARMKIFSPEALLDRLSKKLDVLKGGKQFSERHQTLRQTIAWSYDLLDTEERELFRRVSVFVGGSTLEAVEEICGQNGLSNWDVEEGVLALVDKSLLKTEVSSITTRFFMLETIREFAVEELQSSEKDDFLKSMHLDYFLRLAEEGTKKFSGPEGKHWTDLLFQEQANFRAAIDYAIELGRMDLGYRLGLSLRPFWGTRGMIMEGIRQLEKLADVMVSEDLEEERIKILQALGILYMYIPIPEKGRDIFGESLKYWRKQGDKWQIARTLNDLGWATLYLGHYKESESFSNEAKAVFEALNDKEGLLGSINNLGMCLSIRSRPLEALNYFEETFRISKEIKDIRKNAYAINNIAASHLRLGNYEIAEEKLKEAISVHRENKDKLLEGFSLNLLGYNFYAKGDFEACWENGIQTQKVGREIKVNFIIGSGIEHQALAAFGQKNWPEAKRLITQAIHIFELFRGGGWFKNALTSQAKIALAIGEFTLAKNCCFLMLENEVEEDSYLSFLPALEVTAQIAAYDGNYEVAAQLFFNAQRMRKELSTPFFKSETYIYEKLHQHLKNHLSEKNHKLIQEQTLSNQELHDLARNIL